MNKQLLLVAMLGIYCGVVYFATVWLGLSGHPSLIVAMPLLASPLLLLLLRITAEHGLPTGLFNPSTQSWTFMFGDPLVFGVFVLPVLTIGNGRINDHDWFLSRWWVCGCLLVGYIAGYVFHKLDGEHYEKAGAVLALNSPTKWAHDFVAYPVIFGATLCLGIPVLIYEFKWMGALALAGIAVFGLVAVRDARVGLDPNKLHPKWDSEHFRIITK